MQVGVGGWTSHLLLLSSLQTNVKCKRGSAQARAEERPDSLLTRTHHPEAQRELCGSP